MLLLACMKPILFIAFLALGPALADQFGGPAVAFAGTDLPAVAASTVALNHHDEPTTTRVNDALLCGR